MRPKPELWEKLYLWPIFTSPELVLTVILLFPPPTLPVR